MIKAVIFDLDDTLYPEWSYIKQGFLAVSGKICKDFDLYERCSANDIYMALKDIFFNKTRFHIFNRLQEFIHGIDMSEDYIVNELLPTFRFSEKRLGCYSDVVPTLRKLYGKVKMGIVTNGNSQVQNYKLELLKIRKYFDEVQISGDHSIEHAKPSSYMLKQIIKGFYLKAPQCLYVGDNPETDCCALDIGCNFIRVKREGGLNNEKNFYKDTMTVYNFAELYEIIKNQSFKQKADYTC